MWHCVMGEGFRFKISCFQRRFLCVYYGQMGVLCFESRAASQEDVKVVSTRISSRSTEYFAFQEDSTWSTLAIQDC